MHGPLSHKTGSTLVYEVKRRISAKIGNNASIIAAAQARGTSEFEPERARKQMQKWVMGLDGEASPEDEIWRDFSGLFWSFHVSRGVFLLPFILRSLFAYRLHFQTKNHKFTGESCDVSTKICETKDFYYPGLVKNKVIVLLARG